MKKYFSLSTAGREADLYIFGDIVDAFETGLNSAYGIDGLGEVSGLSIVNEIKDLDVDVIHVHINSMGGYTAEGLAILNTLKNHKAQIVTYCDGFACSAASLIFMAGERRIMGAASLLMIHNAWNQAVGNSAQLRQQADVLEKISQAAANAYEERVSISREKLDALLDGENHEGTWISPQEALSMGFATEIANASESGIANQSAMATVMQRLSTNKVPYAVINLDAENVADLVMQKILAAQAGGGQEPAANNITNFLSALQGRKE